MYAHRPPPPPGQVGDGDDSRIGLMYTAMPFLQFANANLSADGPGSDGVLCAADNRPP